ncbi:enolase C-terminal domain-like protein [Marinigracilibium pacificum]|uniref:Enolase C-terminal domain-containing protein n=1 Tax=Marinigracilibium pacificum TaxID=2729599 RepID=A0A848IYM4_9BACT|nr:enolase C-terminal domain-like protein [Marinigracilibium pacificum]NMM48736.1 hypothetical protein [Marinigracilibium pacificum]
MMKRRDFVLNSLKGVMAVSVGGLLPACEFSNKNTDSFKIDKIELFRYDSNIPRYFSWGTWYNRQQVFLKLTSGNHVGWSETNGSTNNPDLDLNIWAQFLRPLLGINVYDAYKKIKENQVESSNFSVPQLEFIEMNLLDLIGRIENKPAVELLGLKGTAAVPGLFCILNNDLREVEQNIYKAIDQKLDTHVKFKMYGKKEFDLQIAEMARKLLGEKAFILSDVNKGYKDWSQVEQLAEILIDLNKAGLNACEDPAKLTNEQWIQLQNEVGDLDLIPDYVLRPAWEGIGRIEAGMGRYFNMHPDTMGSFHHLPAMSEKIKSFDAGIMIGDASLVGPACSAWQQVAIGVGASWVEAIEKQEDSEAYLNCVITKPTFRNNEGRFAMKKVPGFGVELDEDKLKSFCAQSVSII